MAVKPLLQAPDFSTLSEAAKRELARYLSIAEKVRASNSLAYWKPWSCKHGGIHTSQASAFQSTAKRRLVLGGNRSGKTCFGSADVVHHFLGTHPFRENRVPMKIKVLGEDFPNHMNNVLMPWLLDRIPKNAIKKLGKTSQGFVNKIIGYNGSTIDIMVYEQDIGKFESFDADMAWFDEPPPRPIYDGVRRGLIDRNGYELFTLTPIKEPWIYNDLWMPALEGTLGNTETFVLQTECNPYLNEDALTDLKQMFSEETQDARLRGQFSHLSGLIYKAFLRSSHVVPYFEWPRDWPVYMCIDPHPKKPHAVTWMGVTDKDQKVVLDELKAACAVEELAKKILQIEAKKGYRVVDRLIDTSIGSLDRTDQKQLLASYGIRCRFAKKHDDVMPGIQRVQQMLTPVKGNDGHYIDLVVRDNCRGHILEFMSYVWDDSVVHRPKKTYDDYMDNVRYITGAGPRFEFKRQNLNYMNSGAATYVGHRSQSD